VNTVKPTFFASEKAFRDWLEKNGDTKDELLVGFRKVHLPDAGLTYRQALDQALCFGWIDGVRRSIDSDMYSIRFTPRRAKSIWSQVNVARAKELIELGMMAARGLAEFERRDEERAKLYSYERQSVRLAPDLLKKFKAKPKAWKFFEEQPAGYRRTAMWYVMSAKRAETRDRRLAELVEHCAKEKRLAQFVSPSRRTE
jgi:uncharacterized protein YdeI (YjbR/CyaY-like superfamily)